MVWGTSLNLESKNKAAYLQSESMFSELTKSMQLCADAQE